MVVAASWTCLQGAAAGAVPFWRRQPPSPRVDRSIDSNEPHDAASPSQLTYDAPQPRPADLKKNVALLERAVQTTQQRLIGRVLRNNTAFRRALAPAALAEALKHFLPADEPLREHGLRVLAEVRNALLGIGVVVGSV